MHRAVLAAILAIALADSSSAATLTIDADHTSVGFSVRHLFTRVQGHFRKFSGTIDFDAKAIANSKVAVKIETGSIDTNTPKRDEHLRSADFFDAAKFPTIEFRSTRIEGVEGQRFRVAGELTLHGVTRPVTLDAEYLGGGKDPWGNERHGFHASTRVNRKDFGMKWNETLETGGVLVGDEVEISLDVEALPEG